MHSFILLFFVSVTSVSQADQILVVSGGASPKANHFSQYLQTKTLADELRTMVPQTPVSVFFGAGNATDAPPVLADVHRVVKTSEGSREVMEPGWIAKNQASTRKNIDSFLSSRDMALMQNDETLFLLVSDHGMPFQFEDGSSDSTYSNNCLSLWGFEADLSKNQFLAHSPAQRCFSKSQLKEHLVNNVFAGRAVFAMTQCYSGGFHQMSVDTTKVYPTAESEICGFTSVTEDTIASGCTPEVDGPGYQGYERSFTEQLTGVDVVSSKRLRPARNSFAQAHRAATLEDMTKDIPLSTSDYFLWKWALAIEKSSFLPRTNLLTAGAAQGLLNEAVIGKQALQNQAYLARERFFQRMQMKFSELYPEMVATFADELPQHKALETKLALELARQSKVLSLARKELEAKRSELLAQWNGHVRGGKSILSLAEAQLETDFFGYFDTIFGTGSGAAYSLYEMSLKTITDPVRAKRLSDYKAERYPKALEWARSSGDRNLVPLSQELETQSALIGKLDVEFLAFQKRHGHVRRLLLYRQVLGAWRALSLMQDTQALAELSGLLQCEGTKLSL